MRLLKYELKKLASNLSFFKIIAILLCLSGFLFYLNNKQMNLDTEYYKVIHNEIDSMDIVQAKKKIVDERNKYRIDDWYLYDNKIRTLERIEEEIENILEYSNFRDGIREQYNKNKNISIFKSKNNYNEKYIKKTFDEYEQLEVKDNLHLTPSLGVEKLMEFSLIDIVGIILLIYVAGITIYNERKNGFLMFTQTNYYGKGKQFICKLGAYWIVGITWTILSFFICFVISIKLYGAVPLSTAVQSMPSLLTSTYSLNVGDFIIGYLLIRCFAYMILSTIITLFSYVMDSFVGMMTTTLASLIISLIAYKTINEFSVLSPLKYINIWQILRSEEILGKSILVRVWNEPVALINFIFLVVSILILLILLAKKNFTQKEIKKANKRIAVFDKKPRGLLYYELKKMWIDEKGLGIFSLIIIIHIIFIVNTTPNTNMEDIYYNNFINTIGDSVTEETEDKLIQKKIEFDEIQEKLNETINNKEQILLMDKLNSFNAFNKYKERFYEIKDLNIDKKLLKENEYKLIFEDSNVIKISEVLLFLLIIIIIPSVFQREKETGMDKLQKITVNGRIKLWRSKIITIISIILPACAIIFGNIILKNTFYFKGVNLDTSVTNLTNYFQYNFNLSIRSFLLLTFIIRLIIVSAIIIIFSFISLRATGRYLNIIILSIISILPIIASQYVDSYILNGIYNLTFIYSYKSIELFFIVFTLFILICVFIYRKGRQE